MAGTELGNEEEAGEVDELAGDELFDIPEDLLDMPDYGATAPDDGTDPAKAAPPAPAPGAPPPPAAPAGQPEAGAPAPQPGQPPAAAPAGEANADAAGEGEDDEPELEFSFTADKQPITIKGSKLTKDYLMIPREHVSDVQRLLSHGVVYQGSFRQKLTESAQREADTRAEVQEDVVRAKAVLERLAAIFDQGPEAVNDWLDDFGKNRTKLEADATLAVAKALRESKPAERVTVPGFEDEVNDFAAGVDREELQNSLAADITAFVPDALRKLGIRGLTSAEVQSIVDELKDPDEIERYFGIAGEDLPDYNVKKGALVRKDAVVAKTIKRRADLILGTRKNTTELETAKQKNNRSAANPIPPTTTGAGGTGNPPGKAKKPIPKTKAELDAWMDDDEAEA